MLKKLLLMSFTLLMISCTSSSEPEIKVNYENPLIGIYSDEGAHPSCVRAAKLMFDWMGYNTVSLFANDLNENNLENITLFYFPGGSTMPYRELITEQGRKNLRNKILSGSAYIGTCAGGLIACETNLWSSYPDNKNLFGIFPGSAIGPIDEIYIYPEVGMCKINLTGINNFIADTDTCWMLYYNGPYFVSDDPDVKVIGTYDISGNPAIVSHIYGKGRIVLTGPHPEFEEDSDRDGETYFDQLEDYGSDWPFMKKAVEWCHYKFD